MGMNFRSCCHLCKVQVFHFRSKEENTLIPFYVEHYECLKQSPANLETMEDQIQAQRWMDKYKEVEYI